MQSFSNLFFFIICISCMWLALTGIEYSLVNSIMYIVTILLTIIITSYFKLLPNYPYISAKKGLSYFFWLVKEIYQSAFIVIKIIVTGTKLNPSMEWLDTSQYDNLRKTIYSNSITLTPGTFSVEEQDNKLLIHALDISSINELKKGKMSDKIKEMLC